MLPKLNWSAPLDAAWLTTCGSIACTNADEVTAGLAQPVRVNQIHWSVPNTNRLFVRYLSISIYGNMRFSKCLCHRSPFADIRVELLLHLLPNAPEHSCPLQNLLLLCASAKKACAC